MLIIIRVNNRVGRLYFTGLTFALAAVADICLAFGAAFALYVLVEKPAANLQAALERRLGMRH